MAHTYTAKITWERGLDQAFLDRSYSRGHTWTFDGIEVPASSSPQVVKSYSRSDAIDPEEALLAAASSCHMLSFLDIAARRYFRIDTYVDNAEAILEKRPDGKTAITGIVLRPQILFSSEPAPTPEQVGAMHEKAHELCFIANTLNCEIKVEGSFSHKLG